MEVHIYKAECGDAFRLTFPGDDLKRHHIFIDSGYERTFRDTITHDFQQIENANENIDLWLISHIHDDHIGGAINYINAVQKMGRKDIVQSWWHNPPRISTASEPNSSSSIAASIAQGNDLTNYLKSQGKLPKQPILNSLPPVVFNKLKLSILSPGQKELTALYNKYMLPGTALERNEDSGTDSAAYVKPRDYKTEADKFDFTVSGEDDNADNGSSIAVLAEFKGHRSLWLADSIPSVIVEKLTEMGYSAQKPIQCDLVKISHHGCDNNNSDALYSLINCQHYIISADGKNKHALPNKKALLRLLKNVNRKKDLMYHLYFTHDDPVLRSIFDIDGPSIFNELNFRMHFGTSGFNLS